MEHLWAPWRNTYVTKGAENPAELFSQIAASNEDEENLVVARRKNCFAVLNRYPYNAGHLMVIPYRAVGDLDDLSDEEMLDIIKLLRQMKAALTGAFQPHGFNVGINIGAAAGAGIVQHLHVHLVPRWGNDSNFMTSTANARIHPNDLPQVWKQIRENITETHDE